MKRVAVSLSVSVSEQLLHLLMNNGEEISFPISTSKYGIGNEAGSNKTPLGWHKIAEKIGASAELGTIFKADLNTGRIAKINGENPDDDLITTRIMKLQGIEEGINKGYNIDSLNRGIWMHGTPEENKIGKPASHGCIRMKNVDVAELYDLVEVGTKLNIIE